MPENVLTADEQSAANKAVEAGTDPVVAVTAVAAADPAAVAAKATADAAAVKATEDAAAAVKATEDAAAAAKAKEDGIADPKADAAKGDEAGTGAPETYEDFTVPEGMETDKAAMEAFLPVAKKFDLSQAQAQELVDLQTTREQASADAQAQAWADVQDTWRETTRADTEIGGANLPQTLADVSTFLNKFATPALRQLLDDTGVGNNVDAIRMFSAAGKAMGEDRLVSGNTVAKPRSQAEILYPNTPAT